MGLQQSKMRNLAEIYQLLAPIVSEISVLAGVPGVSVVIIHEYEIVFRHNYGFRDLVGKVLATCDTIYLIGSFTKGFTAATIASLVEDDILEWRSPINKILPKLRSQWSEINDLTSILNLLSMQTDLSRADSVWFHAPPVINDSQIMQVFNPLPQAKPFRSTMQYKNLGSALASSIVKNRTGKSLILNLEQRILEPLEMSNKGFKISKLASSNSQRLTSS